MKARPASKRSGSSKSLASTVTTKRRQSPSGEHGKYAGIRRDLERQRAAILAEAGGGLTNRKNQIRISLCGSRNASRSCSRRSTKRLIAWTSKYMGFVNDAKRSFLTNGSRLDQ